MLIKTIEMETNDDELFSKSAPLLSAASELAYHTMHCSALNAEELRRENGLQTLHNAFARCISVLGLSSKPADLAVQVSAELMIRHVVACTCPSFDRVSRLVRCAVTCHSATESPRSLRSAAR